MRSFASVLVVVWLSLLAVVPAPAQPASCDQVLELLSRGIDPARIASDLETTRARVNACAKVAESADRLAERRSQLHWERSQRGLE